MIKASETTGKNLSQAKTACGGSLSPEIELPETNVKGRIMAIYRFVLLFGYTL